MIRHSSKRLVISSVAILAIAAGGCSSSSVDDGPKSLEQLASDARSHGYEWMASVLDDGDITAAEYDEGQRRNLECLTAAGLTYSEPEKYLTDGYTWSYLINWAGMSDEEGQSESLNCFEKYVGNLNVAMSSWGDWQTEPALLADIEKCVKNAGFEVAQGAKNYREIWLDAADQGLTQSQVTACVETSMHRIHPGEPIAVGF